MRSRCPCRQLDEWRRQSLFRMEMETFMNCTYRACFSVCNWSFFKEKLTVGLCLGLVQAKVLQPKLEATMHCFADTNGDGDSLVGMELNCVPQCSLLFSLLQSCRLFLQCAELTHRS